MTAAEYAAKARKGIVAVVGFVLQLVALGLVPAEYVPHVSATVAALTALGVYGVPNADAEPYAPDDDTF